VQGAQRGWRYKSSSMVQVVVKVQVSSSLLKYSYADNLDSERGRETERDEMY
jgi:hypothetical protein